MEAATTFAKHGIRFVAVPCATDEEWNKLALEAKEKMEAMAVEMEKAESKGENKL